MNCTHPVLYTNKEGCLYCHICGLVLGGDDSPTPCEKPVEAPKNARKRNVKGAERNENH